MPGHHISASTETLLRQAPMTIDEYMRDAIKFIDERFGKGYAKDNPTLLGAFIQASALDYHTSLMKIASQDIVEAISRITPDGI